MEPEYSDGDIVYVQKTDHIDTGEIGIFQKGNSIYIKKAGESGGKLENKRRLSYGIATEAKLYY